MTNLEKMNELVNEKASKYEIVGWAHMNRIWVVDLPVTSPFESMKASVLAFCRTKDFEETDGDETAKWNRFLDHEYIPELMEVNQ